MYKSLLASALLLAAHSSWAGQSLTADHPAQGQLDPRTSTTLTLAVEQGDYLRGTIRGSANLGELTLLTPDGAHYKRLNLLPVQNQFFQLQAEQSGDYQLRLVAADQPVKFDVKLDAVYPAKAQLETATATAPTSPQIRALAESLNAGGNTDAFWQQMAEQGTPLVEPGKQPGQKLVTFLWRGARDNVRLFGSPKEKRAYLERLGDSDVWYKTFSLPDSTRLSYMFSPDVPRLPDPDSKNRIAIKANAQMDPLNKHPWRLSPYQDRFSTYSTLTLESAPADHWLKDKGNPEGTLQRYQLHSEILGNSREISIYRPAGFSANGQSMPVLFFFDALTYTSKIPTPKILDNLIAENKIPAAIAVFIANPSRASRAQELPCNPDFARFMAQELLPWTEQQTGITSRPETTLLSGSSYGGLASTCTAFSHPEKFGMVLSQSGSYWWSPEFQRSRDFVPEWVPGQFARSETKPIRFYLSAGLFETGWQPSDILPSNRHLRDVLTARGYPLIYEEVAAGHDYFSWRVKLADGLVQLFDSENLH